MTEAERAALREAVVTFREQLQHGGYRSATPPSIGRDRNGELFYTFAVRRPDNVAVTFRLTLTTPHGS
ncbi:MAG: hypothetical protein WC565_07910 [Parcubacteria group bacterium]